MEQNKEEVGEGSFIEFFTKATGTPPYPYQINLAECNLFPSLIDIPTGIGKTAAIVIAWLWRRRFHPNDDIRNETPRRLVYCLPMRVLVEQTRDNIILWLHRLGLLGGEAKLDYTDRKEKVSEYYPSWKDGEKITVTVLMGGESQDNWDLYPEREAIIIGTQDMLLSRALNRGYGMSRYRWPMHFGLLNNDSLWVMDEVQLMGRGLSTSMQMQAFREHMGMVKNTETIWMSATLHKSWFKTVDFENEFGSDAVAKLEEDDLSNARIKTIVNCNKTLNKTSTNSCGMSSLADEILSKHVSGTRTLAILNTVSRAKELYDNLKKKKPKADLLLLHSHFRYPERKRIIEKLMTNPPRDGSIIVSTQVIEAGVDISARTLFTEIAPWQSLVQRFGRCNRSGEFENANVLWIDNVDEKGVLMVAPYDVEDLESSRKILSDHTGKSLSSEHLPKVDIRVRHDGIIREKDIFELFDTTPDLKGNDFDISKFVRDADDTNVMVFWREIGKNDSIAEQPMPRRDELCSVPISEISSLIRKNKIQRTWSWNWVDGTWMPVKGSDTIYPSQIFMLDADVGHYSLDSGWSINKSEKAPVELISKKEDDNDFDNNISSEGQWKSIAEHTDEVVNKVNEICESIGLPTMLKESLIDGARWHDAGKAHASFQAKIKQEQPSNIPHGQIAKAPSDKWLKGNLTDKMVEGDLRRKHFRHELVSGILALTLGKSDLVGYLASSHHGKVRLSIRSMPDEYVPYDENIRFAKGVWDGDMIPETDLGGGVKIPDTVLNLSLMELGDTESGPSWLFRSWALCENKDIGIFRLGYLESLLRASDQRASGGI